MNPVLRAICVCVVFFGSLIECVSSPGADSASTDPPSLPPQSTVVSLQVVPERLQLQGRRAVHGILVTALTSDGRQFDVTSHARFEAGDPGLLTITQPGTVAPLADGQTTIQIHYLDQSVSVPVAISACSSVAPPSFRDDVIPLLTRFGCNQGACHGKQSGQNGFRLSLRGYAPEQDHEWNTREFLGRRISRTVPEESLLLRKPLGRMPHAGGRVFAENSRAHQLLREWIEADLPGLKADEPAAIKLEILPGNRTLTIGQSQGLLALAHFADGQVRDVTWLAQMFSNDESVVEVLPGAQIRALRAGETAIRVHFQQLVEVVIVTIPHTAEIAAESFPAPHNAIDVAVFNKLRQLRIPASDLCDDATFLRRAMIDTLGTLPSPTEVRHFLQDQAADKRQRLVETLLQRPEFNDYWTLQLADLLQNRKERDHDVRGEKGVRSLHVWLRQQVAANRPWNEIVREVLTATGDSFQHPAVGYFVVTVGERRQAEQSEIVDSVAQAFLGTRIGCARCHNHPLEKYTQDDYYHFAAFFSRVWLERRDPKDGPTQLLVSNESLFNLSREKQEAERRLQEAEQAVASQAQDDSLRQKRDEARRHLLDLERRIQETRQRPIGVVQPRTGQYLTARPLDRQQLVIDPDQDPRLVLVDWMTDSRNEYFSGSMVNRLWKHFLGTGLVEPVDDLRASNPPSNPELWKFLNQEFVSRGYDLRHVMRLILNSQTYQLSAATRTENEADRRFYSHYYARRLPAEVMLDAISQATAVPESFGGYPVGMRAIQIPDPRVSSYFLSLFGRSDRVTACACERTGEVTLPQLLHLQNGDFLARKVYASENRLAQLLKQSSDDRQVLEELYLATLNRLPTPDEVTLVTQTITPDEREAAFRDVLWALLNTKEFAFNH